MNTKRKIYFSVFALLLLVAAKYILFLIIPEYTTDGVWTACHAYANLRGEYLTDAVTGFRMPDIYSFKLSTFIQLTGNRYDSLALFYFSIQLLSVLALVYILIKSSWLNTSQAFLLTLVFSFDFLIINNRPETFAILFLLLWLFMIPEFSFKHLLGIVFSCGIHPVLALFYIFLAADQRWLKRKEWMILSFVLVTAFVCFFNEISIWLETIYLRLQPQSMLVLLKDLKYFVLFQSVIGLWLYKNQLLLKYIKRAALLALILFIAGKPYYFVYLQFYGLYVIWYLRPKVSFFPTLPMTIVACLSIYLSLVFPYVSDVVLNSNHAMHVKQSNEDLKHWADLYTRDKIYIPVSLAVPFLINKCELKVYDPLELMRTMHKANPGEYVVTTIQPELHDINYETISIRKSGMFTQYNLLLQPVKQNPLQLYLIRIKEPDELAL